MPIESVGQNYPQLNTEQIGQSRTQSAGRNITNELDRDAFLKILVAQLQNQDPLNPIEDQDFIAQLAQFSTLEQMQTLNEGFTFSQATGLVGHHVYAEFADENQQIRQVFGKVTSALAMGGQPYLEVNGWHIPYTSDVIVYGKDDLPAAPDSGSAAAQAAVSEITDDQVSNEADVEENSQTDSNHEAINEVITPQDDTMTYG